MSKYCLVSIVFCLIIALNNSCSNKVQFSKDYFSAFPHLYKKEIVFDFTNCEPYNNKVFSEELIEKKKIAIHIISMDCNSCVEKLVQWNNYHESRKTKFVSIFIAYGTETEFMKNELSKYDFGFPIIWDKNGEFLAKNELLELGRTSLLLDEEKKLILFGDFMNDEFLHTYFKKLVN